MTRGGSAVAPVTAALLVALFIGLRVGPRRAEEPPAAIRVVTLNVLHGGPLSGWRERQHLEARLDLVSDALLALLRTSSPSRKPPGAAAAASWRPVSPVGSA